LFQSPDKRKKIPITMLPSTVVEKKEKKEKGKGARKDSAAPKLRGLEGFSERAEEGSTDLPTQRGRYRVPDGKEEKREGCQSLAALDPVKCRRQVAGKKKGKKGRFSAAFHRGIVDVSPYR